MSSVTTRTRALCVLASCWFLALESEMAGGMPPGGDPYMTGSGMAGYPPMMGARVSQ